MEFLGLLPVLMFFLFFGVVVYNIVKGLKKFAERTNQANKDYQRSHPEAGSGKKSGWADILGDAVSQIQKEMEAARERQARQQQERQRQAGEKRPGAKAKGSSRTALVWDKNAPMPVPPPLPAEKKKAEKKLRPAKATRPGAEPQQLRDQDIIQESPGFALDTTPEDLRKAVIWSEILAPPLALRQDREEL